MKQYDTTATGSTIGDRRYVHAIDQITIAYHEIGNHNLINPKCYPTIIMVDHLPSNSQNDATTRPQPMTTPRRHSIVFMVVTSPARRAPVPWCYNGNEKGCKTK